MKNSIEEDMKILEGIIKGDEDCINAIYSQMKVKNDNDEDIQYYKKEIQSIKNIVNNYLKEKARADKLEKEYSAMLTESDENECDYKRVLKENKLLRKDIEGWKKYCEEIEEEQTEMSNKNCELEFKVEKLQKENEKLKNQEATARKINELLVQRYSNSISLQKVKDLIDRIDYDIKKTKEIISNNSNIYTSDRKNDYQIVRLRAMNTKSLDIKKRLQELLEGIK